MGAGNRQQQVHEGKRAARDAAARAKAAKAGRDPGQFVAWLKPVQQSPGWMRAEHTSRSLLMDLVHSGRNGQLSASMRYLRDCGWSSSDTVTRAIRDLIDCGLLVETRKGRRPNVAAWYAATWLKLEHTEGLDINPRNYTTGGYMQPAKPAPASARGRTAAATVGRRNQAICKRAGYTLKAISRGRQEGAVSDAITSRVVDYLIEQLGTEDRLRWVLRQIGTKDAQRRASERLEQRIAMNLLAQGFKPPAAVDALKERRGLSERTARRRVNAGLDELCQKGIRLGRTAGDAQGSTTEEDAS